MRLLETVEIGLDVDGGLKTVMYTQFTGCDKEEEGTPLPVHELIWMCSHFLVFRQVDCFCF